MNRRKSLSLIIVSIFAWSVFLSADLAAAETRGNLLGDFFIGNQTSLGSFKNSNLAEPIVDEVTEFSTYANIIGLEMLGRLDEVDRSRASLWNRDQLQIAANGENIANIYYTSASFKAANESIDLDTFNNYYVTLLDLQNGTTNGFQSGNSMYSNIADTYFAVATLEAVGLLGNITNDNVSAYVMDCWVLGEGFGGYENATEANLIDTLFALQTLEILGKMALLDESQKSEIKTVVDGHYISDTAYPLHVGAYGIPRTIPFGDITTTYYCVSILNLIGKDTHEETLSWLILRQSGENYGFQDIKGDTTAAGSSATLSYYALSTILSLDGDGLEGLLSEDIWQLKTPVGAIIGIISGIVGVIAIIVVLIWRKKTKF